MGLIAYGSSLDTVAGLRTAYDNALYCLLAAGLDLKDSSSLSVQKIIRMVCTKSSIGVIEDRRN